MSVHVVPDVRPYGLGSRRGASPHPALNKSGLSKLLDRHGSVTGALQDGKDDGEDMIRVIVGMEP